MLIFQGGVDPPEKTVNLWLPSSVEAKVLDELREAKVTDVLVSHEKGPFFFFKRR